MGYLCGWHVVLVEAAATFCSHLNQHWSRCQPQRPIWADHSPQATRQRIPGHKPADQRLSVAVGSIDSVLTVTGQIQLEGLKCNPSFPTGHQSYSLLKPSTFFEI